MKYLKLFILPLLAILANACDDDDPKVPAMNWTTTAPVTDNSITAPASGATYSFQCTNYPDFWVEKLSEGTNIAVQPDKYHAEGQWINVGVSKGHATVIVSPNNSGSSRTATLIFTMGDTSTTFTFSQQPLSDIGTPDKPSDQV